MIEPRLVPVVQRGFAWTARMILKTRFGGLYFDRESPTPLAGVPRNARRLFLYSTHSSWWDPVTAAEIAVNQLGLRTLAPMDAKVFRTYSSLRLTGVFGVEAGDGPQVERLLDREFDARPGTCVWVTPQGRFAPNELEQPHFKTGLSRWSAAPGSVRIPVSIHYSMGLAPRPRIFVRFGASVPRAEGSFENDAEALRRALETETRRLLERVWASESGAREDLSAFERMV